MACLLSHLQLTVLAIAGIIAWGSTYLHQFLWNNEHSFQTVPAKQNKLGRKGLNELASPVQEIQSDFCLQTRLKVT
jgi:putative flippase GtrA